MILNSGGYFEMLSYMVLFGFVSLKIFVDLFGLCYVVIYLCYVNQYNRAMKTGAITKQAVHLANLIDKQYNLLKSDKFGFFDAYHDTMLAQCDCAWQEVDETEYFEKRGEIDHAEAGVNNLVETLKFCTAVIRLQAMTDKLPEPIFG